MATNFASASFQEVIDLHTESGTVSALGIHTPTANTPYRNLSGFFRQFRKYRYDGCSISCIPAAQLPADPLQVSYEAGEPTADPRDVLNPILFKGCHGNDMGRILNQMYTGPVGGDPTFEFTPSTDKMTDGTSATVVGNEFLEALYYNAMTDSTWKKAHPLKGFRKSGLRPLVYQVATNTQLMPNSGSLNGRQYTLSGLNTPNPSDTGNTMGPIPNVNASGLSEVDVFGMPTPGRTSDQGDYVDYSQGYTSAGTFIFSNRLRSLGWIDTTQPSQSIPASVEVTGDATHDSQELASFYGTQPDFVKLPKLYMGMILFSPSYKTELYFRLILNHHFSFKGFRGISELPQVMGDLDGVGPNVYNQN